MNAHSFGPFADPTEDTFNVGDIVTLVTGSPAMVVLGACSECGEVDVAFYDSELQILTLPEEALVHWDDSIPDCDSSE